jgi:DNA transposition AAA+ family ATPase
MAAGKEQETAAVQLQGVTVAPGIRERVKAELAAVSGLTQTQVAREAGMSKTTLSLYLAEKLTTNPEGTEEKLLRWLAGRGERTAFQAILPTPPSFCETRTVADLFSAFTFAQTLVDLVTALAVPGCGKTTAAREFQARYNNVWIATLAAHTTGVVPVLREVAEAVGAENGSGASGIAKQIVRKIKGTAGLLIVDEAQHASPAALDALRALHDSAEVGVVFLGDLTLEAKLAKMPQLYSRRGVRFSRTRILPEDVGALLDAWGITGAEERALLGRLASKPGGLRSVSKALKLATVTAGDAGEGLTLQYVQDAVTTLEPRLADED